MAYWVTKTDMIDDRREDGTYARQRKIAGPFNTLEQAERAAQPYREQEAKRCGGPVSAWRTYRYVYDTPSDEVLARLRYEFGTQIQ